MVAQKNMVPRRPSQLLRGSVSQQPSMAQQSYDKSEQVSLKGDNVSVILTYGAEFTRPRSHSLRLALPDLLSM